LSSIFINIYLLLIIINIFCPTLIYISDFKILLINKKDDFLSSKIPMMNVYVLKYTTYINLYTVEYDTAHEEATLWHLPFGL